MIMMIHFQAWRNYQHLFDFPQHVYSVGLIPGKWGMALSEPWLHMQNKKQVSQQGCMTDMSCFIIFTDIAFKIVMCICNVIPVI